LPAAVRGFRAGDVEFHLGVEDDFRSAGDRHRKLSCPAPGMAGMSTDSPELLAAKRLLDAAKAAVER
jgi:hypothetical protein